MPRDLFLPAAIRARYHYRGDRRRLADERRQAVRAMVEAVLSDSKLARIIAGNEEEWIEEVARTVRRKVRQVLRGAEDGDGAGDGRQQQ